jgi:hypothetical protein
MIAMSERMRMLLEGRGKLSRETPRVKCVLNILIISCARLRISSLVTIDERTLINANVPP